MIMTGLVRYLSSVKKNLEAGQHIVQGGASIWRTFVFIIGALTISVWNEVDVKDFFSLQLNETYKIIRVSAAGTGPQDHVLSAYFANTVFQENSDFLNTNDPTPIYVWAIQALCAVVVYQACKYLSK